MNGTDVFRLARNLVSGPTFPTNLVNYGLRPEHQFYRFEPIPGVVTGETDGDTAGPGQISNQRLLDEDVGDDRVGELDRPESGQAATAGQFAGNIVDMLVGGPLGIAAGLGRAMVTNTNPSTLTLSGQKTMDFIDNALGLSPGLSPEAIDRTLGIFDVGGTGFDAQFDPALDFGLGAGFDFGANMDFGDQDFDTDLDFSDFDDFGDPGFDDADFGGFDEGFDDGSDDDSGFAHGGLSGDEEIMISSGEYIVPPDVVLSVGDGDMKRGAKRLSGMCRSLGVRR